jgi:hypothetical protein
MLDDEWHAVTLQVVPCGYGRTFFLLAKQPLVDGVYCVLHVNRTPAAAAANAANAAAALEVLAERERV